MQITLLITGFLVIMTVAIFLRRIAATFAAAVTVPLSIAGTLVGMWAMGFSLNNYSLMAITISVGFVVDDAIVMIENITRLREQGMAPMAAAIAGVAADRLHGHFHQPVAGRGIHSAAVHGRHPWQHLPRIRLHADFCHRHLGAGVADADADGLRAHCRCRTHRAHEKLR